LHAYGFFASCFDVAPIKEQRICVKFCFKLGKTTVETHRMLCPAYDDDDDDDDDDVLSKMTTVIGTDIFKVEEL
jgi:hypothetical protein